MTATDDRPTTDPDTPAPGTAPAMTDAEKRDLAGRQLVAKILAEEVGALVKQYRDELEPKMLARENVAALLPDGTVIGEVKRAKAPKSAQVVDERALLAWVEKNRPDEIEVRKTVRSSYLDALKAQAKKDGWPYDPTTGEIIPGIEVVEGTPSYRPVLDEDAKAIVMPRLLDLLTNGLLPQLTSGEA